MIIQKPALKIIIIFNAGNKNSEKLFRQTLNDIIFGDNVVITHLILT